MSNSYRSIFGLKPFRRFWLGFTVSAIGDAMTSVALVWLVYSSTRSSEALGILLLCYTGPVLVGGLLAGSLLDRYDRRRVMIFDNVVRGVAVVSVPIAYAIHLLSVWQLYGVAMIYGFFFMITLAGGPSIVPDLVPKHLLSTANALESIGFTVSGVAGPPIAGLIIILLNAQSVMIIDGVSYGVLIIALFGIRIPQTREQSIESAVSTGTFGLGDAFRLLVSNKILLSTTLMFMSFNLGEGFLSVWLPILSSQIVNGGAGFYGLLLGVLAIGQAVGSILSGSKILPGRSLGKRICFCQLASGLSLGLLVISRSVLFASASLLLLGFFSGPLTVWAQTLRMQIIPSNLRGRTFALLRTMMQSTGPLGSVIAGLTFPFLGLASTIEASSILIGAPGTLGGGVKDLRRTQSENDQSLVTGDQGQNEEA